MKIEVNSKRVIYTGLGCLAAGLASFSLSLIKEIIFLTPIFFALAIPLTNFDRINTKKKYQAFLLSVLLLLPIFFLSVPLGIGLGQTFLGQSSIYITCLLTALMTFMTQTTILRIDSIKIGLITTGIISLTIPILTKLLNAIGTIEFDQPAIFFIIWQTVVGFGIGLGVWTKKKKAGAQHGL